MTVVWGEFQLQICSLTRSQIMFKQNMTLLFCLGVCTPLGHGSVLLFAFALERVLTSEDKD